MGITGVMPHGGLRHGTRGAGDLVQPLSLFTAKEGGVSSSGGLMGSLVKVWIRCLRVGMAQLLRWGGLHP